MKRWSLSAVAAAALLMGAQTAVADVVTFDIDETSDPFVSASINDNDPSGALSFMFDVATNTNMLADLRGVFFDITNDTLIGSLGFVAGTPKAFDQSGNEIASVSFLLCQDASGLTRADSDHSGS